MQFIAEQILFAEEVGWVLETTSNSVQYVKTLFQHGNIPCKEIGKSLKSNPETRLLNGNPVHAVSPLSVNSFTV